MPGPSLGHSSTPLGTPPTNQRRLPHDGPVYNPVNGGSTVRVGEPPIMCPCAPIWVTSPLLAATSGDVELVVRDPDGKPSASVLHAPRLDERRVSLRPAASGKSRRSAQSGTSRQIIRGRSAACHTRARGGGAPGLEAKGEPAKASRPEQSVSVGLGGISTMELPPEATDSKPARIRSSSTEKARRARSKFPARATPPRVFRLQSR